MRAQDTTETHAPPQWLLYHGVRNLLRCDGADIVASLTGFVYSQHRSLRLLSALVEATRGSPIPSLITLLGGIRAFLLVRSPMHSDGVISVARLANERRALATFPALVPELRWSEVKLSWQFGVRDVIAMVTVLGATVPRLMRISRVLHRRYASFKVLRVVELLGYYLAYVRIFRSGCYRLAVVSSHTNPHAIAFNIAARRFGVPCVLVTHGMPVRPVARLRFDLAVVHCDDARRTYAEEGCEIPRVLVQGRREEWTPMPPGPMRGPLAVGIFLCKDVNEARLRALVRELLGTAWVGDILVRPHPFNLWHGLPEWIAGLGDPRVRRARGKTVQGDIARADIVLAGNSSVHLDAVVAGRPAVFVAGLDHGGTDLHRFVARGLIAPMSEDGRLDPNELLRFYQRADWVDGLREFANIDEDAATVATRAAEAMRELAL